MQASPSDAGAVDGRNASDESPDVRWAAIDGLPIDAVVTTRHGGVSKGPYDSLNLGLHVGDDAGSVVENRRRTAATVGLALDDLVFCKQVHRRHVAIVGDAERGRGAMSDDDAIQQTDALVTATPGLGLVVMVADCVPIILYDPIAHILACVHAGWGGTVRRVASAAVSAMAGLGSSSAAVVAYLGPAIEADRYQVGDEVAEAAREAFGAGAVGDGPAAVVRPDGTGRWLFDLWAANVRTLVEAGLAPENIEVGPAGTSDDRFFSDRLARPCGRFAAIAVLHDRETA